MSDITTITKMLIEVVMGMMLGEETNDVQLSKNFTLKEFQCPCCGAVKVNPELVRRLQKMRDKLGKPIMINSGYRCADHNKVIGGATKSQHLYGNAADISVVGMSAGELADFAEQFFEDGGLGRYPGHVHVDVRGERARWNG